METKSPSDTVWTPGQAINGKWRVIEKLGEGGFGAAYKVADISTNDEFAMKVESKSEWKKEDSMIRVEAIVMTLLYRRKMQTHACQCIGEGETPTVRFIVMQLLGRSLSELRKSMPKNHFTSGTSLRLGMQCLEAIEMLHKIGFLHRDIKPSNFALGQADNNKRTVFMLDYGLCRQYVTPDGQLRPPRPSAPFRGTLRYASLNAHQRKEQGRHDDLWSFFYMMVEFRIGELPWKKVENAEQVMKKKLATPVDKLLENIGEETIIVVLTRIHDMLKRLEYKDTPNYLWFHQQLKAIAVVNGYSDDKPFDWEPGGEYYETSKTLPKKLTGKKRKENGAAADGDKSPRIEEIDKGEQK